MADNALSKQQRRQDAPPRTTSLPHAHPATSFSGSQAYLVRQAMPSPPPQASATYAPARTAAGSTPVFAPREAESFRHYGPGRREAWLKGKARLFRELHLRMQHIIDSLPYIRSGNEGELRLISGGLAIVQDCQRLCSDIIESLSGLGGPADGGAGGLSVQWYRYLIDEFRSDLAKATRNADLLRMRKDVTEMSMHVCNGLAQLAQCQGEMARNSISGPFGMVRGPPGGGVPQPVHMPQPVHNQNFLPQMTGPPRPMSNNFPQPGPFHGPHGVNVPGYQGAVSALIASQQAHSASFVPGRRASHTAFPHQFDMIASPKPMNPMAYRRPNSFDRSAMGGRQEFLTGVRAGQYDLAYSRRPTVSSQGSFDGQLAMRRWNSHSPPKQQRPYGHVENQWQHVQYNQGNGTHGRPSNPPFYSNNNGASHMQQGRLDKGRGRQMSSPKHRGRSPIKRWDGNHSNSPNTRQPTFAAIVTPDKRNVDSHSVSAEGHAHPSPAPPTPASAVENADMLAVWGQQHTPTALARRSPRRPNFDVPTLKLDAPSPSVTPGKSSLTPCLTAISAFDAVPPHLRWTKDWKPPIPTLESFKSDKEELNSQKTVESKKSEPKKSEPRKPRNLTKGTQGETTSAKSVGDKKVVKANPPSKGGAAEMSEHVESNPSDTTLERAQSDDWQVAGPKTKRPGKEAAPQAAKKKLRPPKEDPPKSEATPGIQRKKSIKGAGDELSQQRELNNGGDKSKKSKKTGAGDEPSQQRELNNDGDKSKKSKSKQAGAKETSDPQANQSQRPNPTKVERRPRKGNDQEVDSSVNILDRIFLPDSNEAAYPKLRSPASALPDTKTEKTQMSWSLALKTPDPRAEAEQLRVAAAIELPMSPGTPRVRRPYIAEKHVSIPLTPGAEASINPSAISVTWSIENLLTLKQKTPGPRAKASSGELRATATPFTPPAAGDSILSSVNQLDPTIPDVSANALIPTYAHRARAAGAREEEASGPASIQSKKTRKASAVLPPDTVVAVAAESTVAPRTVAESSDAEHLSRYHTRQVGLDKLSLSEHTLSMSVSPSFAGSVSSPGVTSVKSMPSTPMVPTYAQRAASATLLNRASPSGSKIVRPLAYSGNAFTPKAGRDPQPVPITPAAMSPESPKTLYPSAYKSSLNAAASTFSYAARLAAPAPPLAAPLADPPHKEIENAELELQTTKTANSTSSVRGPVKKGGKDKVCDPPNHGSHFSAAAKILPATPLVPSRVQKAKVSSAEEILSERRFTLLRLTTKQNKKATSKSANESAPAIDASAMMVTSRESARASFASTATTTTSASSATLVSSETISSESATTASLIENSDVGDPSPVHQLKALYKPSKTSYEDGYKATPPMLSPAETWAQKAGRRYVHAPPMHVQETSEHSRESRLTTPTGAKQTTVSTGNKHWRGGKPGTSSGTVQDAKAEEGKDHSKSASRAHKETSREHVRPRHRVRNAQGGVEWAQGPHQAGNASNDGTSDSGEGRGSLEQTKAEVEAQSAVPHPRCQNERTRRSATSKGGDHVSDNRDSSAAREGKGSKAKQTKPGAASRALASGETVKPSEDDSGADSQGTVKANGNPKIELSRKEKKLWNKNRAEKLKVNTQTREACPEEPKQLVVDIKKAEENTTQAQATPMKLSWADADDEEDEWAGFEELTTPEVK